MYETPDLETDVFVRSHEIRLYDAEGFEGMRKAAPALGLQPADVRLNM